MKYRNILILLVIYAALFGFLYCLVREYPGDGIGAKIKYLLHILREDNTVLLKVTIVYAVCLSIPYIPGGLGYFMVAFAGFKGVIFFMAGTAASMGVNFIIGRRFPIIMAIFKRQISKHLGSKDWWPSDENVDIFRIIRYYFEEDNIGSKIYAALRRVPVGFRFNEQTIIFLALLMPVNMVVGGGGGVALVCGEESTLSFFKYMQVVLLAHGLYVLIPWGASFFLT